MQLIADQSATWAIVAAAFGLFEFVFQLWITRTCPFRPMGDEIEYLERGRSSNPFRFPLFHRLPVLPTVSRLAAGTGDPCFALRLSSAFCSAVAMAATAGAATRVGGPVIAAILCLFLVVNPERALLGTRIWPDVYLAAATSGFAMVFSLTPSTLGLTSSAVVAGVLIAFGVLVRLDALVLIPAGIIAWIGLFGWQDPLQLIILAGLPTVGFLGWWLASKVVLGETWPDTTWKFNLGIAEQDALAQSEGGDIVIDDLIERHHARTATTADGGDPAPKAQWISRLRSIMSRFRAIVGPDAFVSGKLLVDEDNEHCVFSGRFASILLRLSVPLMLSTCTVVYVAEPTTAGWIALPSIALMIAPILFHARTRYRLPMVYGLTPVMAGSLAVFLAVPHSVHWWMFVSSAIMALTAILAREPRRLERP